MFQKKHYLHLMQFGSDYNPHIEFHGILQIFNIICLQSSLENTKSSLCIFFSLIFNNLPQRIKIIAQIINTPSSPCKAHTFVSNLIKYGKKKYFRVPTEEIPLFPLIIHSSHKCYWAKTSVDIIHVLRKTPGEKKQIVDD